MKEITIMVPINAQAHSLHQPALTSLQDISERIPPKPVYSRTGPSVSLIAIAVSPRDISMSLSKRLQQMQDKSQLTKPDFSGLSLEEMDQMKIAFGHQQLGKPFKEVWDREQSWVTWFTQHYENSQKYEHQIFLHYIEKRVERAEVTQQAIPVTNVHQSEDQDSCPRDNQKPSHAQELCHAQVQEHGAPAGVPGDPSRVRLRPRPGQLRSDSRAGRRGQSESPRGEQPACPCDGAAPLPDGELDVPSGSALGSPGSHARAGRSVDECQSLAQLSHAGDLSADCCYAGDLTPEGNQERKRLWQLVQQFSKEFDECLKENVNQPSHSPKITLLEVFCGPSSQLTHQARQLGYRAERCGKGSMRSPIREWKKACVFTGHPEATQKYLV